MHRRARSRHALRRNKSSRRPSRLVFVDADSNEHALASGAIREIFVRAFVCNARRRKTGYAPSPGISACTSVSDAWDSILSQSASRSRTIVVSSSPVRTLTLLRHIEILSDLGWILSDPVSSARFTAISWRKGNRSLLFVAHGNLFPAHRLPRDSAQNRVGAMRATWLEYMEMLDEIGAGDFHLSVGAQALGIYRHKFLYHPIYYHGNPRADEIEIRSCFGAIYQPYFFGRAPGGLYHYLDTNAMYPAMMATHEYPYHLVGTCGTCPASTLHSKLNAFDVIASVRIETDEPMYPVRENNRTMFPVGTFNTTLTTPDLRHAYMRNRVRAVYAMVWYDHADLFSSFVNYFWALRKELSDQGRIAWSKWAKSMAVALYGRWGAHIFETRCEGENPLDHDGADQLASADDGEVRWYHTLSGKMWSTSRSGLHRDSFPAIMAHIAAYGRHHISTFADQAGREHVYAILSDGLIVDDIGYSSMSSCVKPDELGKLKLKLSGDEFEVLSDTEYRIADHVWRPGVKQNAVEVMDGVFVQHLDPNLTTLSRMGNTSDYVHRPATVHLKREIRTGTVLDSGWIAPLSISQPPPPLVRVPRL
jgi:hypothetical protein